MLTITATALLTTLIATTTTLTISALLPTPQNRAHYIHRYQHFLTNTSIYLAAILTIAAIAINDPTPINTTAFFTTAAITLTATATWATYATYTVHHTPHPRTAPALHPATAN